MQIFRELAGYSYGRADVVRRAMSKKKLDVMERERAAFVSGCADNGIDGKAAELIFEQMSDFAKYAFNKSHAACYALVAYRTAYLKCYYPAEFMAALMTSVLDQTNKIARYTAESKRLGLKLGPPDINTSMRGFTANGKVINYGLLGIKNVGREFVDEIVAERKNGDFTDLVDFCTRMQDGHFNRRAVESLIRCGAMDCFDANRRQMLQALPSVVTNIENYRQNTKYGQVGFFELDGGGAMMPDMELPNVSEFPKTELLEMEKDMTGLYLSGHPLDKYDEVCRALGYANIAQLIDTDANGASAYKDKSNVKICGIITRTTLKQTKNGAAMAFVMLEDMYCTIELVVFPKMLERYSSLLYVGNVVSVSGTLSIEEEKEPKLLVNELSLPPSKNDLKGDDGNTAASSGKNSNKKKKRYGLFLRFKNENDSRIPLASRITTIFDGNIPLFFYYTESGHYELQPRESFVDVNETELNELKRLLGDENVVYIKKDGNI